MSAVAPLRAPNRRGSHQPGLAEVCRARHIVALLGGRFSLELGIDVDLDEREVDRWALGATLVEDPSPTSVGIQAYRVLGKAGVSTFEDVRGCDREELWRLLGECGYGPYVDRTRSRLLALADGVAERYAGRLTAIGEEIARPRELERMLASLPGWDARTVATFLRELRGVWSGAKPALDLRVARAAGHVALPPNLRGLSAVAAAAHLDLRDLEVGLVRLGAAHDLTRCPGGEECPLAALDREYLVHF
ncbi:MAG: putative cytoplasmic protein [Gaiellaceae bacterium]|jgi:hypothetical protein|nr:putative cytoplasmic protein [Gaiellaceae bacterium]